MKRILALVGLTALLVLFAHVIGQNSWELNGVPVFYLLIVYVQLVQIIAFIPALIFSTEKFYDLTGSFTYVSATLLLLLNHPSLDLHQHLTLQSDRSGLLRPTFAGLFVLIWAGRLGFFLFSRVLRQGEDSRFRTAKKKALVFFSFWWIQGIWVAVTGAPVFALLSQSIDHREPFPNGFEIAGIALWALGILIQTIADRQKSEFKRQKPFEFISGGLWAVSRHPNYCGEVLLWSGVSMFCYSSLQGWTTLALISPVFEYILLTKLSGVPILQAKSDKKWGDNPQYQKYVQRTPVMFPVLSSKGTFTTIPKKAQ